jgi:hypothetical protein
LFSSEVEHLSLREEVEVGRARGQKQPGFMDVQGNDMEGLLMAAACRRNGHSKRASPIEETVDEVGK